MMGDIKKMYPSVKIETVEQHTHRFLWRDMDTDRDSDTFIVQTVSFGDKPAGTIATVALRKTADMSEKDFPEAAKIVKNNSYMDDILDSVNTKAKAYQMTKEIETGAFEMKSWILSGEVTSRTDVHIEVPTEQQKALGTVWNPGNDCFHFEVKLNFSPKSKKLRMGPDLKSE